MSSSSNSELYKRAYAEAARYAPPPSSPSPSPPPPSQHQLQMYRQVEEDSDQPLPWLVAEQQRMANPQLSKSQSQPQNELVMAPVDGQDALLQKYTENLQSATSLVSAPTIVPSNQSSSALVSERHININASTSTVSSSVSSSSSSSSSSSPVSSTKTTKKKTFVTTAPQQGPSPRLIPLSLLSASRVIESKINTSSKLPQPQPQPLNPSLAKSTLRPKFDFSKLVPIKILQQEEWGTTSLASFSAAQRFALKKTGCAKISIKGVPSLTKLQSSVSDQIEALSELTHGKLTAYTYKFVESTAPIQLEQQVEEVDLTNTKVWYCVPPADYIAVVNLISKLFANSTLVKTCPQAVMHKRFLIHPDTLRENGITCSRIVHVGSASTKTNLSAFGVSVTAPADAFEDIPVGSKRRPYSPPPSPTHSDSTVEVDICDEDFLLS